MKRVASFTNVLLVAGFIVGGIGSTTAATPPPFVRAVQCGAFDSKADADACQQRLTTLGYAPVWTIDEDGKTKVLVGRCDYLPDTFILKKSLAKQGFEGTFTRTFPNDPSSKVTFGYQTPDPTLLLIDAPKSGVLSGGDTARAGDTATFAPEARTELLPVLERLSERKPAEAAAAADRLLPTLSDSDPAKGWLLKEQGKALVERDLKAAPSVPSFVRVAKGEVAASAADRQQARFLAADSWHYFYPNPLRGYQAYHEILKEHGKDPALRARALVEVTACLLELARRDKATFEEVRRSAALIKETVPARYTRAHAAAELIACESIWYEGDSTVALEAFKGFEERHAGRTREVAMSYIVRGRIYGDLGDWENCRNAYEIVLDSDLSDPKEQFYWQGKSSNLPYVAASWLAHYANKFNDMDRLASYVEKMKEIEPELAAPVATVTAADAGTEKTTKAGDSPLRSTELDAAYPHSLYEEWTP